ncbi:unnamed protein product [Heterobilharzia americana]|nr:unnamed protein product [Heterobilharzia americana]
MAVWCSVHSNLDAWQNITDQPNWFLTTRLVQEWHLLVKYILEMIHYILWKKCYNNVFLKVKSMDYLLLFFFSTAFALTFENTAVLCDLILRFPDAYHSKYSQINSVSNLLKWSFNLLRESKLMSKSDENVLHLTEQELNFIPRDINYVNEFSSRQFCSPHEISEVKLDSFKNISYCTAFRSVLLYGYETWPLKVEEIKRLRGFDHRCLHSIARVLGNCRMNNIVVVFHGVITRVT